MDKNAPDMKVRLSAELRRKIEDAAKVNNRTMNAEIVSRLERTFREDGGGVGEGQLPDLKERLSLVEGSLRVLQSGMSQLSGRVSAVEKHLESS